MTGMYMYNILYMHGSNLLFLINNHIVNIVEFDGDILIYWHCV